MTTSPQFLPATPDQVDWADPSALVATYLTVRECIWLRKWGRLANASDGFDPAIQGRRIFEFANGPLSRLRYALALPFVCHDFYRPPAYNVLVKGAKESAHQALGEWAAVDFDLNGAMSCDVARKTIVGAGYLEEFKLRMEDRPGSNWVHIGSDAGRGPAFFVA